MNKDNFLLIYMLFASIFCIFFIINFKGCAKRVVYKEVKVPIKCDIELPEKPRFSGDLATDISRALEHSELLEKDLIFCVKGDKSEI